MKLELVKIEVKTEIDYDADLSYLGDASHYQGLPEHEIERYLAQDQERIAAYNNGDWFMVGVYAEATLRFKTDQGGWQSEFTVRTPGVWQIESDGIDPSYRSDELDELERQLAAMGYEMTQEDFDNVKDNSEIY